MDRIADGESEDVSTFEETLRRFVGLSSEEIWELQRILVRRVRCKVSETLSPEGKTAMKQVKQEMHERQIQMQKLGVSASLVTEIYDFGSKLVDDSEGKRKTSKNDHVVLSVMNGDVKLGDTKDSVDFIEKVAGENKLETENTKEKSDIGNESMEEKRNLAGDGEKEGNNEKAEDDNSKVVDDLQQNGHIQDRLNSRGSSRRENKQDEELIDTALVEEPEVNRSAQEENESGKRQNSEDQKTNTNDDVHTNKENVKTADIHETKEKNESERENVPQNPVTENIATST